MEKLISKKMIVVILLIGLEFAKGFGLELPPESAGVIQSIAIAYLSGQSVIDAVVAYQNKRININSKG